MKNPLLAACCLSLAIALMSVSCNSRKMTQGTRSMEPTIKSGETITVELNAYNSSNPSRWDVVLFESPLDSTSQWCYRVVGLPGEKVEIRSGDLIIDGAKMPIPSRLAISAYEVVKTGGPTAAPGPVSFPYELTKDSYFVLGDNVSNALDSRYWGALERSRIIGKVDGK